MVLVHGWLCGFAMHRSQAGAKRREMPLCANMAYGDQLRHFWDCALAQSLRGEMRVLLICPIGKELPDVWLVKPPWCSESSSVDWRIGRS